MTISRYIEQELDDLLSDLRNHNDWDNDNETNWEALINSVVTIKEMLNDKDTGDEPKPKSEEAIKQDILDYGYCDLLYKIKENKPYYVVRVTKVFKRDEDYYYYSYMLGTIVWVNNKYYETDTKIRLGNTSDNFVLREGDWYSVPNSIRRELKEPTFLEKEKEIVQEYNTDGGKNSYYDIDVSDIDTIDVDDISERYGFNHYEFNTLKALVGIAKWRNEGVSRHNGTSALRDAKKALYALNKELLLVMRLTDEKGE